MTEEVRYKIVSNDYIELLIRYDENLKMFEQFPNWTYHIISENHALLFIPKDQLNTQIISKYGYASIPTLYGLNNEKSLDASRIINLRRLPSYNLRGQGVLIAIIDTGIDYTNPAFLNKEGKTKIKAIWDQSIESDRYPLPYSYGTEFLEEEINHALASEKPFELIPSRDLNGHGTMLAGIAAGSELPEHDFSGVTPDAELVIVKLKQAKPALMDFYLIPREYPCFQENDAIWGVKYAIEKARQFNRPLVLLIGFGSSKGSHDGRGVLSSILDIEASSPGLVICVAAGNEGNDRRHFYGEIDPAIGYRTVELNVAENESGLFMELWGAAPNTYSIDIMTPSGEYIPKVVESLRLSRDISFVFETTTISLDYQMIESSTGDQLILLRFRNPSPGIWRFQVYGRGDLRGSFHVWLPAGNYISENTYFLQSDPYTTITSPGNSPTPITVTAYNHDNMNLYQKASKGYSRTNIVKPEIAAPGIDIMAPTLEHKFTLVTGTSAAVAHTAGVSAMTLEWGILKGKYPSISTIEVKKFLIRGAERYPSLRYPNRDWGYGILDIYNVFDILRSDVRS